MAVSLGFWSLLIILVLLPENRSCEGLVKSCTQDSCFLPFPFCDKITHRCEAIDRDSMGWSHSPPRDAPISIVCSEDGDYPSTNCHTFYRCRKGTATRQTCSSPGYPFFDPAQERCTNAKNCPTFDCFNIPNDKIGLTDNLSPFFSYCIRYYQLWSDNSAFPSYNDVTAKVISRCFGKDTFNPNSRRCEALCLQEGLIPDTTDCHKYFMCILKDSVNVQFSRHRLSCPQGESFQQNIFRCVPSNQMNITACESPNPHPI